MSKYTDEFKLMIVREYLKGPLGYKLLAKKYDVPDKSSIQNWVKMYQSFGKEGLRKKSTQSVYAFQFKLDVLNFRKQTGASYRDTAVEFNINNPSLIVRWNKIYLTDGIEGLKPKQKGRPSMSKPKKSKQSNRDKVMSHVDLLKHENELLKLEVAYLKKLKAFQANPHAYLEKPKQHWHSNSKKMDLN